MDAALLSPALRSVIAALHKGLRKQMYSVDAFSLTEMETIGHLYRRPSLLPTELAGLARVKTQTMSQLLNRMQEQGIIKKTASKTDRRKVFISLTAAGKKMIEKTKYDRDELLKKIIEKSLTEKEKELIAKALPALNKLIQIK